MSTTTPMEGSSWRGEPLTMGQLGSVLLRHWVLLVIGLLVGALAGFAAAQVTPKVYTATSTMLIKAVPGTSSAANYEAAQYAVARAKAYPVFIYNLSVLSGIQSDLGTKESLADLQADLSAATIADTPLVQITADGSTPNEARDKANAALRRMSTFITQIETVNGRSPVSVEVAVLAAARPTPASPRPLLYIALGAVAGFALAIAVSLLHGYVRAARGTRSRRGSRRGTSDADGSDQAQSDEGQSDQQGSGQTVVDGDEGNEQVRQPRRRDTRAARHSAAPVDGWTTDPADENGAGQNGSGQNGSGQNGATADGTVRTES